MKIFKYAFLSLFLWAFLSGMIYAGNGPARISLNWSGVDQLPLDTNIYQDIIKLDDAFYTDTLPGIPVFSYNAPSRVPLYKDRFEFSDKVFEPVSEAERALIDSAGYRQTEIQIHTTSQSSRKQHFSGFYFVPIRYNASSNSFEKLVSFTLNKTPEFDLQQSSGPVHDYPEKSVLAEGSWYRFCVEETGIHRLTYEDLEELGVNTSGLSRADISIFGIGGGMLPEATDAFRYSDLVENAIYVTGSSGGTFGSDDYILFYGKSPHQWDYDPQAGIFRHEVHLYSDQNCYFLTTDQGSGKRISSQQSVSASATHNVNKFQDFAYHQRDLTNLINSGRVWFGEVFDATLSRSFSFNFPDLDHTTQAHITTYLAARASAASSFTVAAGSGQMSAQIGSINPTNQTGNFARYSVDEMWFSPSQGNSLQVNITYNRPFAGARGWLNYIAVNVTRQLQFNGPQMGFRNTEVTGAGNVAQYTLGNAGNQVTIWDVTDRFNIRSQQASLNGSNLQFRLPADSLREFVAFDGSSFLTPELKGQVENQNLHGLEYADMIIVSPEDFLHEARRLADFRKDNDGISSLIVTPRQVYNEFSSGTVDITAIRNFMKMFYDRASHKGELPRYLLLFGNGTLDNRGILGYGGNFIPTFQTLSSFSPSNSYMTDDYFGLLSDGEGEGAVGLLDIGIGRMPVRSPEEAAVIVDKLIRYDKRFPGMEPGGDNMEYVGTIFNYADWRNMVVLVADDGDNNRHINDAENLSALMENMESPFNLEKIYLDAYEQVTLAGGTRYPDVNKAINKRVNKGALLINYIGHGGTQGLAHERVLTFEDIATWNNYYNMPVLMTATCEFSSFDQPDPENLSAGVRIFLKPDGGAAALFTTTRLAWASTNYVLNENFMEIAFSRDEDGERPRLGDLIRKSKVESHGSLDPFRIRNFVLLGDPSMRMAYPEYKVETESMTDSIRAFQEVTVSGFITDELGNPVDDYNGIIFPTVYDKKSNYQTFGHDAGSHPKEFAMHDAMLYKGKASVVNGEFTFSFMVPKDIAYNFGPGRISYYVDDGSIDGHGSFTGFKIGGTLDDYEPDNTGPEIDLYMNDTTFVSGGTTDENPILLAMLRDESGINITGRIGHDIVAYLNEDFSRPIVLNDFFQADLDTYNSGRVVYPFSNLEDGRHTISLRAWDLHNNPAQASIDFIVSSSGKLTLQELMNYPNPFNHETYFRFKHNHPFSELDVRIEIYDLQGRLVRSIKKQVNTPGFQSTPIRWDGSNQSGTPLGNGIYVYRLTVSTPDGLHSRQSEKLVIMR